MVEASGSQATHQDSLLLEQEKSITETCELEAGKSLQQKKRGRPQNFNGGLQDNQESGKKDALDPATVNNREITEYQQEWPFIKESSFWAVLESQEFYQNPPQKPHFLQLKKINENSREGAAIGHMVTFRNVVEKTSELRLDDPNDVIEKNLETLVELETHGFDVGGLRARLMELLSIKAKVGQLKDKLKEGKKELEKQNLEMSKIKATLQELQEKLVENVKEEVVKDREIKMLQSNLDFVSTQIHNLVDVQNQGNTAGVARETGGDCEGGGGEG